MSREASQEQGQTQQTRMGAVWMNTGAGDVKTVREGFQEVTLFAPAVEGSRSVKEVYPRVWFHVAGA